MSKSSSGDKGGIDPYKLPLFYCEHWFSQRDIYTPEAREEFRRREIAEEKKLAKMAEIGQEEASIPRYRWNELEIIGNIHQNPELL